MSICLYVYRIYCSFSIQGYRRKKSYKSAEFGEGSPMCTRLILMKSRDAHAKLFRRRNEKETRGYPFSTEKKKQQLRTLSEILQVFVVVSGQRTQIKICQLTPIIGQLTNEFGQLTFLSWTTSPISQLTKLFFSHYMTKYIRLFIHMGK